MDHIIAVLKENQKQLGIEKVYKTMREFPEDKKTIRPGGWAGAYESNFDITNDIIEFMNMNTDYLGKVFITKEQKNQIINKEQSRYHDPKRVIEVEGLHYNTYSDFTAEDYIERNKVFEQMMDAEQIEYYVSNLANVILRNYYNEVDGDYKSQITIDIDGFVYSNEKNDKPKIKQPYSEWGSFYPETKVNEVTKALAHLKIELDKYGYGEVLDIDKMFDKQLSRLDELNKSIEERDNKIELLKSEIGAFNLDYFRDYDNYNISSDYIKLEVQEGKLKTVEVKGYLNGGLTEIEEYLSHVTNDIDKGKEILKQNGIQIEEEQLMETETLGSIELENKGKGMSM